MNIILDNVVPNPILQDNKHINSDIWNKKTTFEASKLHFVQAPSGTGKTTLIHILYNTRTDYQGSILLDNKNVSSYNQEELATLRAKEISIIFQDLKLFPHISALDNILVKNNITNHATLQQIESWADELEVKSKLNNPTYTLSYGEQQRIAIIRALCQPFKWLLMDEPFSHLDNDNTKKAAKLILNECKKQNAGFVLADLDPNTLFEYDKTHKL